MKYNEILEMLLEQEEVPLLSNRSIEAINEIYATKTIRDVLSLQQALLGNRYLNILQTDERLVASEVEGTIHKAIETQPSPTDEDDFI